jgi:hypothetical protein
MLPTVRVTINPAEYRLLKPGLDLLANRLATARLGSFPNRHPWHQIDYKASNVYLNQTYDELMAAKVIEVRAKLWELSSSRRIYVNFVDLNILALALRLLYEADKSISKKNFRDAAKELAQKLEKFRKRAKRSTISAHGRQSYDEAAARWRGFSDWARYNLLYSRLSRRKTPFLKGLWRSKRVQMAELVKVTVKERYDFDLTEWQVNRICQLVIPSLRRRRHDLTFNTVLLGSDAAKDFLIAFITKRFELKKGPNAPLTYWEQRFKNAEILGQFMRNRRQTSKTPGEPLPLSHADVSSVSGVSLADDIPAVEEVEPAPRLAITDAEIVTAVSCWFIKNVNPRFWKDVCDQARYQVIRFPSQYSRDTISKSLTDLIAETRPVTEPGQLSDDYVNPLVEWLLGWMLALRSDLMTVSNIVGAGYASATRSGT